MSQQTAIRRLTLGVPVRRSHTASADRSLSLLAGSVGALWRARRERVAVARCVARVNGLGFADDLTASKRAQIWASVKHVAERIDMSQSTSQAFGYGRRALHVDPDGRWSLALIVFRPGQMTEPHDHDGWGCAVVVRGVERERRFAVGPDGRRVLTHTRDFAPGAGYTFDPQDIHQVIGAAPDRTTVALHFLLHGRTDRAQRYRESATIE